MTESANPTGAIHELEGGKRLAFAMLGWVVRRWQDTLVYQNTESIRDIMALAPGHGGSLVLLWHNRLFACAGALMQAGMASRRLYALVSASRDGAQLSHFLNAQGIHTVRGSSSRRGALAARELVRVLADGHHVAITVDGPRGPCYQAQSGASLLVQLTGAPVVFLGAECESCWELRSWDRFIVPKPFSRVRILMEHCRPAAAAAGRDSREALQARLQAGLMRLTRDSHRRPGSLL